MFAEQLVSKIGGLRPVELWTPETGRTKYLSDLAAKDETKAKVKAMAWDHVQDLMRVKKSNLANTSKLYDILERHADEVYHYICRHNLGKLAKSDKKI